MSLFSSGLQKLSHPSFFLVTNDRRLRDAVVALRKSPETFEFLSSHVLLSNDPVIAVRNAPFGVELLGTWGIHLHSLFEIHLPLRGSGSLPAMGDISRGATSGIMVSFQVPEGKGSACLSGRISRIGGVSGNPIEAVDSFLISSRKGGGWAVASEQRATNQREKQLPPLL